MEGTECTKGSSQTGREWLKLNDMVYDCNVGVCERRKRRDIFLCVCCCKDLSFGVVGLRQNESLWFLSCPSDYVGGWLIFTWFCLIWGILFMFFPSWAQSSSWLSCIILFSDTGHVRCSINKRSEGLPNSFFFFHRSCESVEKVNFCQDFMRWKPKKELSLMDLWADV